ILGQYDGIERRIKTTYSSHGQSTSSCVGYDITQISDQRRTSVAFCDGLSRVLQRPHNECFVGQKRIFLVGGHEVHWSFQWDHWYVDVKFGRCCDQIDQPLILLM